ncbi:MAG: hypothetical protein MOB07_20510 [Acidobacteria bacterium]|nr:hypothetical protein [Acidobacteriota bacterium]
MTAAELEFDLGSEKIFNIIRIRENIKLGQRVDEFAVDVWRNDGWAELGVWSSIGAQRLIRGERITTRKVRLRITRAAASPCISEIGFFAEH